jgi:hypothetical protein
VGKTRVQDALDVLDEVKYLEDETFQSREGHTPPPFELRERLLAARVPYFRLRARAAELRADLEGAREWQEKAAAAEKLARSGSFTWMRWSSDD